jgi:hypothetical protein
MRKPCETCAMLEKPSKADLRRAEEVLRYYAWPNVLKAFPKKRERQAIAATLEWLGLNSVCAWRGKDGRYSTTARTKTMKRLLGTYDACVIDRGKLDEAEALMVKRDGPR